MTNGDYNDDDNDDDNDEDDDDDLSVPARALPKSPLPRTVTASPPSSLTLTTMMIKIRKNMVAMTNMMIKMAIIMLRMMVFSLLSLPLLHLS